MNVQTPGTNRSSRFRGGTFMNGRWYCMCNEETKYVKTGSGPNKDKAFFKCPEEPMCGFWLWVEHETEARRRLADTMSPEPQTPSRPRQSIEPRSQYTPSMASQSYANTPSSTRVLRSARQGTPTASQITRRLPSPLTPDDDEELATIVLNLLDDFKLPLNTRQKRKLQVVIDDYIEKMERVPSDDDRYEVD